MSVTSITAMPTVRCSADAVTFHDFTEIDPTVRHVLGRAGDVEQSAHQMLALGARVMALGSDVSALNDIDGRVRASLDSLADATSASIEASVAQLSTAGHALLNHENGDLIRALRSWSDDLDKKLARTFDPASKQSVVSSVEAVIAQMLDAHDRRVASLTDPDDPLSSSGRLLSHVRRETAQLRDELRAATTALGLARGHAVEHGRTAIKGVEFEDQVIAAVANIVAGLGDDVHHAGTSTGSSGSKKGDVVVEVADVSGGRYVLEAKDTRLSLRATWRELEAAAANREAAAAIAVFASQELSPSDVPFMHAGSRAVVVLDRNAPDDGALRLACLWARWIAAREATTAQPMPSHEHMAAAVDRARDGLARLSSVRRSHSAAAKAIDGARSECERLGDDVRAALADLEAGLCPTAA